MINVGFFSSKQSYKLQQSIDRPTKFEFHNPLARITGLKAVMDDSDLETGPALSQKKRAVIEDYVQKMNGKRAIQRILIANNGMAATKAILSMKQWAYTTLGTRNYKDLTVLSSLGIYV